MKPSDFIHPEDAAALRRHTQIQSGVWDNVEVKDYIQIGIDKGLISLNEDRSRGGKTIK